MLQHFLVVFPLGYIVIVLITGVALYWIINIELSFRCLTWLRSVQFV